MEDQDGWQRAVSEEGEFYYINEATKETRWAPPADNLPEGWDARLDAGLAPDAPIDVELSVGDVVLSGGELGAMMVIDACARLLPGVLGDENSSVEDSFSSGALDHPHYARPAEWRGQAVPEVLMSGDHAAIRRWRRQQALARTWERRPDLLDGLVLSPDEQEWLRAYIAQHAIDAKR